VEIENVDGMKNVARYGGTCKIFFQCLYIVKNLFFGICTDLQETMVSC
jgi:hypothetical protein